MIPTRSTLACIVAAAISPLVAQSSYIFPSGERVTLGLPGLASPDFTSAVAGHLTGMSLNDAVLLASGSPWLLTAPGIHRSAVPLPLPALLPVGFVANDVRDVAILRAGGMNGRDALALLTGGGLWSWYTSSQTVGGVTTWSYHLTALDTSQWVGAKRLRVADVNGDGTEDVLAIAPNERGIRCLLRGTPGGSWLINANAQVRDFVVADVARGGTPEIVAVTGPITGSPFQGGVRAFSPNNGNDTIRYQRPHTAGVCASLRNSSTSIGVVVGFTHNGQSHLETFTVSGGAMSQVATSPLSAEPTAVVTAVWKNPQADVFVSYRTQAQPVRVRHTGNYLLGATAPISIGPGSVTNNRAVPLFADFAGDPSTTDTSLQTGLTFLYGMTNGVVHIEQRVAWSDKFVRFVDSPFGPRIQTTSGSLPPTNVEPTHVELETWPMLGTPGSPGSPVSFLNLKAKRELLQLTPPSHGSHAVLFPQGWLDASWPPHTVTGFVSLARFVHVDGAGNIVRRWPARNANFARTASGWQAQFLLTFADLSPQAINPPPTQSLGIAGDVIQPPPGPDGDDDVNPPTPGG